MKKFYLLILVLSLTFTMTFAQTNQNWKWLHPTPQGNTLRWVKMWDANNWYAVGYAGTFMKTTNAGVNWTFTHAAMGPYLQYGQRCNAYGAYFFNQSTGILVGTSSINSAMYRTTNGGVTFDSCTMTPFYAGTIYSACFINNNTGFAVGTTVPKMYKTTDGGVTWNGVTTAPTTTLYDVAAADSLNIIVSTTAGNVARSYDGGATWTTISTGASVTLYKIAFVNINTGFVAGSSGACRYTTNSGLNWTLANTGLPTTDTYYDLDVIASQGSPSLKLNEGFDNTTFPPVGWTIYNVLGTSTTWVRSTSYYNSAPASAYISYDASGGEDWLVTKKVTGIASGDSLVFWWKNDFSYAYPPDSLYIKVSTTDSLMPSFTTTIAGISTADAPYTWTRFAYSLSAFAGQNIYIAFKHINTDGNGGYLDDVSIVGAAQLNITAYLTGNSYSIYKSTNFGTSWDTLGVVATTNSQPWTSTYYAADFRPGSDTLLAVGAFGLVNRRVSASNRTTYATLLKPGTFNDIWGQSLTGNIIAVGAPSVVGVNDQILRSTNGGTTWSVIPYSTTSATTLQSICMLNNTTGFVCGTYGAIYKTTNAGLNWDSVIAGIPATASLSKILFVDANTGWLVGVESSPSWVGLIMKTTDGGFTWTQQTNHCFNEIYDVWFADANTGWVTSDGPQLQKTTNGGINWNVQTISSTSFLNSVQFVDANTGWCVGEMGQIFYTNNGGGTISVRNISTEIPDAYTLNQNYPNPFNPSTKIRYSIPKNSLVRLTIFDALGREVQTLVNQSQVAGTYEATFEAGNYPSGIYFYKLSAGDFSDVRKMILVK
jgi:photosystem II stability/assembly factor-like uncharacterized protein